MFIMQQSHHFVSSSNFSFCLRSRERISASDKLPVALAGAQLLIWSPGQMKREFH